jgi:hypothetical protein
MAISVGFEPSQEHSSSAKELIRPSRVPTPSPKSSSIVVLLTPQPRTKVANLLSETINNSTVPKPMIISFHYTVLIYYIFDIFLMYLV